MAFIVVYDACALYPAPVRDLLLRIATGGLVRARWTHRILEELPGANTQGETLDEARSNLREAVEMIIDSNRALAQADAAGADVIREPLNLSA